MKGIARAVRALAKKYDVALAIETQSFLADATDMVVVHMVHDGRRMSLAFEIPRDGSFRVKEIRTQLDAALQRALMQVAARRTATAITLHRRSLK